MTQTTITGLPNATLPLDGSERFAMDQAGQTVDAPLSALPISTATQAALAQQATANAGALAALNDRLNGFRDGRTYYVSKRISASDNNNGTSPGEPFATPEQAVAAATAYRAANPDEPIVIELGPGVWQHAPLALPPDTMLVGPSQRTAQLRPAAGTELQNRVLVDSGCMVMNLTFTGHQAQGTSTENSATGQRAWAVAFNQAANGGQGPIIRKSPYIKDCVSITAEQDAGLGGSVSVGDTGGGVEIDGAKVHPSSPLRSMVIYGFTQQNLGGPGAVVKNDGYAEFVSFFGIFCTWHVQCETGGQATLSGGGSSQFGIYGLVADGYSATPIFTGSLMAAAYQGDVSVDVGNLSANRLGPSSRPAPGQLLLLGGQRYTITSSVPITGGYRVNFYAESGTGLAASAAQGAAADFRQASEITTGCHNCRNVGAGTNYNALPWRGGVPVRANEVIARNGGKVYGAWVNEVGDFKIAGGVFAVNGITGAVTINTNQFNLSGLNAIGPFSRNGITPVGVQLQEVSNDVTLTASTGTADGNTAPTQYAVKTYAEAMRTSLLALLGGKASTGPIGSSGLTMTAGILGRETGTGAPQVYGLGTGLSITGGALTPAVSAYPTLSAPTGFGVTGSGTGSVTLTFASGYSLPTTAKQTSWDSAAGLAATAVQPAALTTALASKADLVGGVIPSSQIPAIAITDYLGAVGSQAAMLALSGQRGDWCLRTDLDNFGQWILAADNSALLSSWVRVPQLAAPVQSVNNQTGIITLGAGDVGAATAAQGAKADSAVQPAALSATLASYLTIAAAGTTYQPLNSGLTAIAALTTTSYGVGFNALANASAGRSYLGLATVASTGAYSDLSGRPTLGTAAAANTGTSAGNVVALDNAGKLPAVDASQLTDLPASGITSIGLVVPTGLAVAGSPLTSNGSITLSYAAGYSLPTTTKQGQWDTAYAGYLQWDGGATGLNAATGRTSLGLGSLATQSGTFSGTSSGTNTGDQTITLTGDATGSGTGSFAVTLASTAVGAGSYGAAGSVGSFTVDAKGRLTAASNRSLVEADLSTTLAPQFARLGVGGAASSTFAATLYGAAAMRSQTVTISGTTYTFDCAVAGRFLCAAAINGATTFQLTNHNLLPAPSGGLGLFIEPVIQFTWTSGAITFSASGYTFATNTSSLTSGQTYRVILTINAGDTKILPVYSQGVT